MYERGIGEIDGKDHRNRGGGRCMKHNTDYLYNLHRKMYIQIRSMILFLLGLLLFLFVVLRFVTFPVKVGSDSMQQDLAPGNLVFVTPLIAARPLPIAFSKVDRGDIVLISPRGTKVYKAFMDRIEAIIAFFTFRRYSLTNPLGLSSLSPSLSRIAALPGDTLYMKDNILYVRPAGEENFRTEFDLAEPRRYNTTTTPFPSLWHSDIGVPGDFPAFTLGSDEFFLLADDRSSYLDSRIWGPVNARDIVGKVWLRYFPLNRLALF
jgi:signal peptidase I